SAKDEQQEMRKQLRHIVAEIVREQNDLPAFFLLSFRQPERCIRLETRITLVKRRQAQRAPVLRAKGLHIERLGQMAAEVSEKAVGNNHDRACPRGLLASPSRLRRRLATLEGGPAQSNENPQFHARPPSIQAAWRRVDGSIAAPDALRPSSLVNACLPACR